MKYAACSRDIVSCVLACCWFDDEEEEVKEEMQTEIERNVRTRGGGVAKLVAVERRQKTVMIHV